jgi:hypothetical protein
MFCFNDIRRFVEEVGVLPQSALDKVLNLSFVEMNKVTRNWWAVREKDRVNYKRLLPRLRNLRTLGAFTTLCSNARSMAAP